MLLSYVCDFSTELSQCVIHLRIRWINLIAISHHLQAANAQLASKEGRISPQIFAKMAQHLLARHPEAANQGWVMEGWPKSLQAARLFCGEGASDGSSKGLGSPDRCNRRTTGGVNKVGLCGVPKGPSMPLATVASAASHETTACPGKQQPPPRTGSVSKQGMAVKAGNGRTAVLQEAAQKIFTLSGLLHVALPRCCLGLHQWWIYSGPC